MAPNAGLGAANPQPPTVTEAQHAGYRDRKTSKAKEFPATFLDIPRTAEIISEQVSKKERDNLLHVLTVMAILFGIIQIVTAFSPSAIEWYRHSDISAKFESQEKEIKELSDDLKKANEEANLRTKLLEEAIAKLKHTPPAPANSP